MFMGVFYWPMTSLILWRRRDPPELTTIYRTVWDTFEIVTYHHRYLDLFLTVVKCTQAREILAIYGTRDYRVMERHQRDGLGLVFILMDMIRERQDDW